MKTSADSGHIWAWSELAQQLKPERTAYTPVWEVYRKQVPTSWYEKGYVVQIKEEVHE